MSGATHGSAFHRNAPIACQNLKTMGRTQRSSLRKRRTARISAGMMRGENAFTRFEHEGWERVADKYDSVWSSLTRQFVPHLIDRAQISSGMSVLDVACGHGYVSAAVRKLGAIPTGILGENGGDGKRDVP